MENNNNNNNNDLNVPSPKPESKIRNIGHTILIVVIAAIAFLFFACFAFFVIKSLTGAILAGLAALGIGGGKVLSL